MKKMFIVSTIYKDAWLKYDEDGELYRHIVVFTDYYRKLHEYVIKHIQPVYVYNHIVSDVPENEEILDIKERLSIDTVQLDYPHHVLNVQLYDEKKVVKKVRQSYKRIVLI